MIHAIVQILKVDEAMSMEYKIDVDGCLVSGSKSIETIEDYEKFKKHISGQFESLDQHFRNYLEIKKKNNGQTADHRESVRKIEAEFLPVQ